jgi:hypothetical protein
MTGQKTIPYRSRLMLSMLLGQNIDGSTNGMTIARNQMAMLYVGLHNETPRAVPQDLWREEVLRELGEIKGDVRVIKCRLGIEGICPPGEPK